MQTVVADRARLLPPRDAPSTRSVQTRRRDFIGPQLGKRGLYPTIGGDAGKEKQLALLWVLNQSDGEHSLLDVAERSQMRYAAILEAAESLSAAGLLEAV